MEFQINGKQLEVGHTSDRTLLMQGGALGPTIYKCLKLGVWLSLDKEKVWPHQRIHVANDFSHKLKGSRRGWGLDYHYLVILLIIFADDMQLYFDTRNQMEQGARAFIEHLRSWGLNIHVTPQIDGNSKSKAMLCPAERRIEITNEGTKHQCNRPPGSQEPLQVPGGYIKFVDSYKFLGSIWTSDTGMAAEIANRKHQFFIKLHQCKDMLQSRHVSLHLKKEIARVCIDEVLFYSTESMVLTRSDIQQFESARSYMLRIMRRITRYDQRTYHISGKDMQREFKMASALEKIMRRHFRFIAKIINKSPKLSPERMMMGSPKLKWCRNDAEVDMKTDTWNPAHGKTTAMFLEDRAMQLYYYIFVLEKETDLANPKSIIRALLSYEGTQAEMTQPNTWMEMITETPELWERVVIYGQFQTIDKQENEQQKRNRRNNTFAIEIPEKYYARQNLNRSRLLQKIRHEIAQ